ncbi:hypothetical protein RB195_010139 [Necator americanus]|uniref:Uncharacterized protein n=1 Tax=Necator americanus TaxID=51031 RepID=A0ABR1CY13_NECAM
MHPGCLLRASRIGPLNAYKWGRKAFKIMSSFAEDMCSTLDDLGNCDIATLLHHLLRRLCNLQDATKTLLKKHHARRWFSDPVLRTAGAT